MELIRHFKKLSKADVGIAGGKGASLGEMTKAGIPVPEGFVILSDSFERFIEETDLNVEIDSILHKIKHDDINTVENASEKIKSLILNAKTPKDIEKEILSNFKKLNAKYVAVRSSATAEDSQAAAWAGQLESYLNTTQETILENVKKCWASLFTPRAIFYRIEQGLHNQKVSVAVVVQNMIDSVVSGIAFSVHPVTQDYNQIIIEAGYGLGEAIVSGQITPDSYVVEKEPRKIIDKNIAKQEKGLYKVEGGGNEWKQVKQGNTQKLSDKEILELTELIIKIEKHYGFPCDIEWAKDKSGTFYILQSRPITTLEKAEQKPKDLLDKFMNGFEKDIFYPLVPVSILAAGAGGFSPNFGGKVKDLNIKFLIAMKEGKAFVLMSETRYNLISENFFVRYMKDSKILSKTISYLDTLEKEINEIYFDLSYKKIESYKEEEIIKKLDRIISLVREYNCTAWFSTQFDKVLAFEFINKHKLNLKSEVLENVWDKAIIPIEDSFDRRRHKKILNLISNSKDVRDISEEMQYAYSGYTEIKSIKDVGENIKKDYSQYLGNPEEAVKEIKKEESEYKKEKESFKNWRDSLNKEEKKLADYIQTILVLRDKRKDVMGKGIVINFRVGERFFREIGLNNELIYYCAFEEFSKGKDYLEGIKEEIFNRPRGVLFLHNYDGSIEFEYDNFEDIKRRMEEKYIKSQKRDEESIRGQVAYKGNIKGRVKIILRPSEFNKFKKGDILVTSMTRPEFVPIMRQAKAIITDEGGITSHAAIISRELKIPCIIGTKVATQVLKDGMQVEVDADNGIIRIIQDEDETLLELKKHKLERFEVFPICSVASWEYACHGHINNKYYKKMRLKENPCIVFYQKERFEAWIDESSRPILKDKKLIEEIISDSLNFVKKEEKVVKDFLSTKDNKLNKEICLEKLNTLNEIFTQLYQGYLFFTEELFDTEDPSLLKRLPEVRINLSDFATIVWEAYYKILNFIEKEYNISRKLTDGCSSKEIESILNGNEINKKDLEDRAFCLIVSDNKVTNFYGKQAEDILNHLNENHSIKKVDSNNSITGKSAFKGIAVGKVLKLDESEYRNCEKILKGKKDYILVTPMTRPEIVPYLKNAKAIVTDEGGITCHAAIVARELKIPCIIGTKIATHILKEGDFVEVDADKGTVEKIK